MKRAEKVQSSLAKRSNKRSSGVAKWAPLIGGGALALLGLTRRSKRGVALATAGGLVALAGAKQSFSSKKADSTSSVLINCTRQEAYQFWSDFQNLPRFMHHLESVTVNGNRSHWVAIGPLDTRIRWNAEVTSEKENESIAWRSLPGGDIQVEGSVEFREAPAERGTILLANIRYTSPAGAAGKAFAKLLGKDPSFLMRQDLRRFRALIETGEIPTTEGQSHGPRSAKHPLFQALDPDAESRKPASSEGRSQHKQRRAS